MSNPGPVVLQWLNVTLNAALGVALSPEASRAVQVAVDPLGQVHFRGGPIKNTGAVAITAGQLIMTLPVGALPPGNTSIFAGNQGNGGQLLQVQPGGAINADPAGTVWGAGGTIAVEGLAFSAV